MLIGHMFLTLVQLHNKTRLPKDHIVMVLDQHNSVQPIWSMAVTLCSVHDFAFYSSRMRSCGFMNDISHTLLDIGARDRNPDELAFIAHATRSSELEEHEGRFVAELCIMHRYLICLYRIGF